MKIINLYVILIVAKGICGLGKEMGIMILDDLVKESIQKNEESIVSIIRLTKEKIGYYIRYSAKPYKFTNYEKIINKLDDENIYYEIESLNGFNLLEFNGFGFKSIELEGDNNSNTLKKFNSLDELNIDFQKWTLKTIKLRGEAIKKFGDVERKIIKFVKEKQKTQIDENENELK